MRIALLTDGIFPYVVGGMQRHSYYLAKYFAKNGIEIDLYHTNFDQSESAGLIELDCFSMEEKKYIKPFFVRFPSIKSFPGHYLKESYGYSALVYDAFIKNKQVDFIYAKGFSAWKLIEEIKKGKQLPPVGVNFHGYEMFQKTIGMKSKLKQYLLRNPVLFNIKNSDYVFSYGGGITKLIEELGIQKNKIIESPAGIAMDWMAENISSPGSVRKFIFIGRHERRKGVEEINSVIQDISDKFRFEFHFIGDIPEKHRLNLPCVKYWGKITDKPALQKHLSGCDVLVCPSYSEGMPNVILEAMASGLSVIASKTGAVDLLVNSHNGWLINPGNRYELKEAILSAIKANSSTLLMKKQYAWEHISKFFLIDKIVQKLIEDIKLRAS